jgi:mannitol/fructose-specific phosphotransferase system IIA component (Ntr-type)
MPTATGNGVAFLHTLRRHPDQVTRPFMILGRSHHGVDFSALDGRRTHLFFALGLKYPELHLPWLTKLAQMLAEPAARTALLTASDVPEIYDVLSAAERRLKVAADVSA